MKRASEGVPKYSTLSAECAVLAAKIFSLFIVKLGGRSTRKSNERKDSDSEGKVRGIEVSALGEEVDKRGDKRGEGYEAVGR